VAESEAVQPRARVERLEGFALEALPSMRLADGAFCHEVCLPGPTPLGRSLRYTLMCCLGLLRAERAGMRIPEELDPESMLELALREMGSPEMSAGDLGLLLWADVRAGGSSLDKIAFRLHGRVGGAFPDLEGMELSWIVIGAAEAGANSLLDLAIARQLARIDPASGLFRHRDGGRRARFPNFATQIYGVLALAVAARNGRTGALEHARRAADTLIDLQLPDGGWPWLFDTARGRVVEAYEVYSVHQDAMAPMALLELSEVTGEARFREAALRGLDWIFGRNDLSRSMLDPAAGILHRSIRRRRPFDRLALYANTAGAGLTGRAPFTRPGRALELNPTDRPYHLGWVLEAWAGREGLAG
jgi:hypothetical protein